MLILKYEEKQTTSHTGSHEKPINFSVFIPYLAGILQISSDVVCISSD